MKYTPLQIFTFILARTVFNTMYRMTYPFLAVFARGLGVPLPWMGLAMTARASAGTLLGPFAASLADRRGRKSGMLLGLLIFSLGAGLVAIWPSYAVFLLALVLTVVGKYVFDPSMQAYLGDRVGYARRGLVIALTELGWSLSFIAGVPLAGWLIARYGWQAPFPLLAVLGVGVLLLLSRMLPTDPAPTAQQTGLWGNFRRVFASRPAKAGLLMSAAMGCANEMVNLVFGLWIEDSFGLKIAALAAASAVIGLSELGGEGLTAALTDRIGKGRAIGWGLAANCATALALPLLGRSLPGALVGLFLFYITFEFTLVSSIPLMTELLPEARATLMSANVAGLSLGRAFGALVGGPIYTVGIFASCLAAVAFNLLSLAALRRLGSLTGGLAPAHAPAEAARIE